MPYRARFRRSWADLANLYWLHLGSTALSGAIPPELGDLSNLTWLALSRTALSGAIPPELGGLSNLEVLEPPRERPIGRDSAGAGRPRQPGEAVYLGANALSGAIPPELGNLQNLVVPGLGRQRTVGADSSGTGWPGEAGGSGTRRQRIGGVSANIPELAKSKECQLSMQFCRSMRARHIGVRRLDEGIGRRGSTGVLQRVRPGGAGQSLRTCGRGRMVRVGRLAGRPGAGGVARGGDRLAGARDGPGAERQRTLGLAARSHRRPWAAGQPAHRRQRTRRPPAALADRS